MTTVDNTQNKQYARERTSEYGPQNENKTRKRFIRLYDIFMPISWRAKNSVFRIKKSNNLT